MFVRRFLHLQVGNHNTATRAPNSCRNRGRHCAWDTTQKA
jgi:hypothetical protein